MGRDGQAILSHHLGDLDYYTAFLAYEEAIDHYERLFAIEPELIVHDLHPDYATTRYAHERSRPSAGWLFNITMPTWRVASPSTG